jgi:hypothetical protein
MQACLYVCNSFLYTHQYFSVYDVNLTTKLRPVSPEAFGTGVALNDDDAGADLGVAAAAGGGLSIKTRRSNA